VPVPDLADRLPRRAAHGQAIAWWVGAHGGAGETTLARLAFGTVAAEHSWPMPAAAGIQSRVILVARTNYAGLTAAQRAAREWASGALGDAIRLEGLVLVADQPGKLPKELRELAHLVCGGVPRSWELPWVAEWRVAPATPGQALPTAFVRMFSDLNLRPSEFRN